MKNAIDKKIRYCPNCGTLLTIDTIFFSTKNAPRKCRGCSNLIYKNHQITTMIATLVCSVGIFGAILYGMTAGFAKGFGLIDSFFFSNNRNIFFESIFSPLLIMTKAEHHNLLQGSRYRAYIVLVIIIFSVAIYWADRY